jgi:hypothetical protein
MSPSSNNNYHNHLRGKRQTRRQCPNVALKGRCKPAQHCKRDISFTAFHGSEIRPIHLGHQGKLFLRQADAFALDPDPTSQTSQDCFLVHRQG